MSDEQPTIEAVTSVVLSYNDPQLISTVLDTIGWSCTTEIIETISIAKQNKNLASKLSAIKYLRKLLQDAAEMAGMIGSVSRTVPGADGSQTTFHAKRVALALNPERKKITSIQKEITDGQEERKTEGDVGSVGNDGGGVAGTDSGRSGGTGVVGGEGGTGDGELGKTPDPLLYEAPPKEGETADPCIQHRPPTCDPKLFPGVSSAGKDKSDSDG